jgi:hypothetical protein
MSGKLREMLLEGNHKFNIDLIAHYVGKDAELFNELINLMLNEVAPIPQRASWAMTTIADKEPWMIEPHIEKLINHINNFDHPALTRCFLRTLSQMEPPANKLGELFDICYNLLIDAKQPAAIRVFAMQVLYNISEKEPDLKPELKLIIETNLDNGSTGYANRAGKLLKKLDKYLEKNKFL